MWEEGDDGDYADNSDAREFSTLRFLSTKPLSGGEDSHNGGAEGPKVIQRRYSSVHPMYFDHTAVPNRPGGDDETITSSTSSSTGLAEIRRRHSVPTPLHLEDEQDEDLAQHVQTAMRLVDGPGPPFVSYIDSPGKVVGGGSLLGTPNGTGSSPTGIESFIQNEINDYFENTENRARAWAEGARNLQYHQYTPRWPLYVVEFKAGRKDFFFFAPDSASQLIRRGDFCICEADRGKDLGKVVEDNMTNMLQVQAYQSQFPDSFVDQPTNGEVQPKRIFRLAQTAELAMLATKMHDEELALVMCQQKARQRRLPMEVVDAEFQWDRKKLTFYFVADRRIDFRELVRELFKVYKTRIWLCACGGDRSLDAPLPMSSHNSIGSFNPSSPSRGNGPTSFVGGPGDGLYRPAISMGLANPVGTSVVPPGPPGLGNNIVQYQALAKNISTMSGSVSGYGGVGWMNMSNPVRGAVGGMAGMPTVGYGNGYGLMGSFGALDDGLDGSMTPLSSDSHGPRPGEMRR
ncbi:hypothetical protein HDU93_002257 [Gonapodya sp. JEL0774]|nr:hypothetical protein HDU93_002257 [Gonapodya sp. JEL0774]